MTIRSLHGKFVFGVCRFRGIENNKEIYPTWFGLTGQFPDGYVSSRLGEFAAFYSNRMSYAGVSGLLRRVCGTRVLSGAGIREIVTGKASEINKAVKKEVTDILSDNNQPVFPEINTEVGIYDGETGETLISDDGIQVRKQKTVRQKAADRSPDDITEEKRRKERINTSVIILEKSKGGFAYMTAPNDEKGDECVSLKDVVRSRIIREYGGRRSPLNIVAITDGATDIRRRLREIFGFQVTLILDWYHLCKKMREHMSMISRNRDEKSAHLRFVMYHLWRGNTAEVLNYMKSEIIPKNGKRLTDLVTYIEKHRHEIINYELRRSVGKTIGSGRVEKACDQVVGFRQKKKGMSWGKRGSRALATLKIAELNGQWDALWKIADHSEAASNCLC